MTGVAGPSHSALTFPTLALCLAEADEACRCPIDSQMISNVQATRSRLNFLVSACRIVQELLLVSYTAHHLSALL